MRRREFLIGAAAAACPVVARAQQAMPVIGFLGTTRPDEQRHAAFRRGLAEQGLIEGQSLSIEFLFAESQYDRLPAMVAEFQRRRALILASGNQAALAIKAANISTPTVFSIGESNTTRGSPPLLGLQPQRT